MQKAQFLGEIQVTEAILGDVSGDSGNCIYGDDTPKYHLHFQIFQITTKSGCQLSFRLSQNVIVNPQTTFE